MRPRRPAARNLSFQSRNPPCSSRWEAFIDSPVEKPRPARFSLPPLARPCPSQGAQNLPMDLPFRTYGLRIHRFLCLRRLTSSFFAW